MLACTALVGCSDDDVLNNAEQENQQTVKMDTYVTVSIDASTSSSRTSNDGDNHGDAENSGHENTGSDQENAIKDVLVILSEENVTEETYDADIVNGVVQLLSQDNFEKATTGEWEMKTPYKMDQTGNYKALVVINPVEELKDKIDLCDGNHAQAYNEVLSFHGESITEDNYFMMANREPKTIKVEESHNSPAHAAGQEDDDIINVERAASKITFRWKEAANDLGANVYPVTVATKAYKAKVEQYWYMKKDDNNNDKYYYAKFNVATASGNTYYILLNAEQNTLVGGQLDPNTVVGVFQKEYKGDELVMHNGYVESEKKYKNVALLKDVTSTLGDKAAFIKTLTFDTEGNVGSSTETYYIKLEQYALMNKSKTVYAVRHVSAGKEGEYTGAVATMQLLGNTYQYLIDPHSKDKTTFNETNANLWFDNPFNKVQAAANTLGTSTSSTDIEFKKLPGSLSNSDPDTNTEVTGNTLDYKTTGAFLEYCHENAVLANNQIAGWVTGIVFVGKIYSNAGCTEENVVQKMYKYDNVYYETLRALLEAKKTDVDAFANLTENSSDNDAKAAGIEVYNGGTCFYYSSQIEHFDNDGYVTKEGVTSWVENGPGIMENAIMRNNIYSLSVKGLSEIGSATLDLDAKDEVADKAAYITMQAKILPWIVRFNDIEF